VELQHINVKIFVEGDLKVDPLRFIDLFHEWIQEDVLDGLLIDVADYRHVQAGPGVILVGLDADYSMDNAQNRWGLRYNRKAPLGGGNEDRLREAVAAAANACLLLERRLAEEGPVEFSRQELEIFVNDRALAPNTPQTLAAVKPEIEAFLEKLLGHHEFSLEERAECRRLFGLTVRAKTPFDLGAMAKKG